MKWFLRLLCLSAVVALFFWEYLPAQTATYRVFLKDKGPDTFTPGSALYEQTLSLFTPRALDRRRKVLPDNALLSLDDAPVYQAYLDELAENNARVLLALRWRNYAVVECDSADSASLAELSFVRAVRPTSSRMVTLATGQKAGMSSVFDIASTGTDCGDFRYGLSYDQAASINVPPVHKLGITGTNVLLGFLDSGFRWRTQPSIAHANVVAEYDFIFGDSVTANQQPDIPSQDDHGTLVFSTVGGFLQDSLVGIAPNAKFMLGKTEDIRSEKHIEEDNYAAGVEWMESQGVDIISSSLGYYDFDNDQEDYFYEQLDGKTTVVAQAVNRAVAVGVVCITAAGNEGNPDPGMPGSIISPGDADSVITVAAAAKNQPVVAPFSSRGPRGDGARKPDIAAQGVQVYCADADNIPIIKTSDGTSLATPLLAGGAALVLSVFPELRPWELRELLFSTASQATNPDTALGYGVADIFKAISSNGIAIAPDIAVARSIYRDPAYVRVVVKMISSTLSISGVLHVQLEGNMLFSDYPLRASTIPYTYYADVPVADFRGAPAQAYITASNGLQSRRLPFHEDSLLTIDPTVSFIPCGITAADIPFDFAGNIIEGVYPSVARRQETDVITIALTTPTQAVATVQLYNILGQRMLEHTIPQATEGMTTITLPISSLAVGTYFIQVVYNGAVQSYPFTVVP